MSFSGIFARIVALIGAVALQWRKLQGAAPEPAWGTAPVVPQAKPQGWAARNLAVLREVVSYMAWRLRLT